MTNEGKHFETNNTYNTLTDFLNRSDILKGILDTTHLNSFTKKKEVGKKLLSSPASISSYQSLKMVDNTESNISQSEKKISEMQARRTWRKCFGVRMKTEGVDDDGAYKVSGSFALISVFVLLGIGLLTVKYFDEKLPEALLVKDILDQPNSFIEERARKDLHRLISVGVRVSGSYETDNITVENILSILNDTRSHVLTPETRLEFEVQKPTGEFFRGSGNDRGTSCYSKIANVVARMEPMNRALSTNHSILVNCHFDSKSGSPGATDDMISCAVMLEIIRVLAGESQSSLRNPIIFLFNGAEETGLQGSHGFIKGYEGSAEDAHYGHRWAKNVKAFINLEGAGGGGREILFQTGPGNGWTLETYAKAAPYPYGSVIAEEAFQLGLIPSYTDFQMFTENGGLAGLDMAFIKNGWVYHTKWDRDSEIPAGSIQHMGANTLAILRHFSGQVNFSEVDTESTGKMVFFDVLGLFMIFYPRWAGILIDALVALATIAAITMDVFRRVRSKSKLIIHFLWLPVSAIISWVIGVGAAAIVALFLNGCGYYKPFYSYPTLAIAIFGIPAAISQTLVHAYTQNGSPLQTWMAQKLTLAVILLVGTFITRAVYIVTINLLFSIIAWYLVRCLCRGWPRGTTLSYLITGEFVPFLMSAYLLVTVSDVFVPILGHSGSEMNANLFFGLITAGVVTVLIWNGFAFVFVQFRKRILWTCLLAAFFVLNTVLVFGFVGKVPYQEKTPMRINIVNVDRAWYEPDGETVIKSDTGYWFWPYDSNTKDFLPIIQQFVPELSRLQNVSIDYENCKNLQCAQPVMWPMGSAVIPTHWLPHNSFAEDMKSSVKLTTTVTIKDKHKTVGFSIYGPPQISLVISPSLNYKLVNWSLTESIPESGTRWEGRDTYFIYHGRGVEQQTIQFSWDFELKDGETDENSSIATVQFAGFFEYGKAGMTDEFEDLIERMPSWTYTMPWTAVLKTFDIRE